MNRILLTFLGLYVLQTTAFAILPLDSVKRHWEYVGIEDWEEPSEGETKYRFTFAGTGQSATFIVIRVESEAVHLEGWKTYLRPGFEKIEKHVSKDLTTEEWDKIKDALDDLYFWEYKPPRKAGLDGSYWYLDGVKDGKHHIICQWSPDAGKYRAVCLTIWRASGLFMGGYSDRYE